MHPRNTSQSKRKKTTPAQENPKPRPLRVQTESRLGSIKVPHSLRAVLLDFTLCYFIESPKDVVKFGYEYFKKIKDRKSDLKKHGEIFEDSYSDDDQPKPPTSCYRCKKEIKPCQGCQKIHRVCRACTKALKQDPACVMAQHPHAEEFRSESKIQPRQERRDCIFAEGMEENQTDDWVAPMYEKTAEQKTRLLSYLQGKTLFKELETGELNTIAAAMFLREFVADELVIKQGRGGDFFYIVQSGQYRAYTKDSDGNVEILKNYDGYGSFGELALMYNVPRHCSVKALTDGKLWVLDRDTFRRIVITGAMRKRDNHIRLLRSVPILKELNDFEIMNVADSLDIRHYNAGDKIIKQGDEADGMFFIDRGNVTVTYGDEYGLEVVLGTLSDGAYFGELALIEHQRRAATVTAASEVSVAHLHRDAFERLLGPCVNLMNRKAEEYEKQKEEILHAASHLVLVDNESNDDDDEVND